MALGMLLPRLQQEMVVTEYYEGLKRSDPEYAAARKERQEQVITALERRLDLLESRIYKADALAEELDKAFFRPRLVEVAGPPPAELRTLLAIRRALDAYRSSEHG